MDDVAAAPAPGCLYTAICTPPRPSLVSPESTFPLGLSEEAERCWKLVCGRLGALGALGAGAQEGMNRGPTPAALAVLDELVDSALAPSSVSGPAGCSSHDRRDI